MTIQLGANIFTAAFYIYVASALCYIIFLIKESPAIGKAGKTLLFVAILANTASLLIRTIVLQRPPLLNYYEYMASFTWGAGVVYIALESFTKKRTFGGFAVPLISLIALFASTLPSQETTIMPALMRSVWRVPHVVTAILAYGAFAITFVLAIMYLLNEGSAKKENGFWAKRLPSLTFIDQAIYRTNAFGFLMLTMVIIVGAVWAQNAWGRYWGWDPKETWSFITWLIYAAYLHTRSSMGWKGHRSAIMALIGFPATLFTLLGVNFLLPGLHSYTK